MRFLRPLISASLVVSTLAGVACAPQAPAAAPDARAACVDPCPVQPLTPPAAESGPPTVEEARAFFARLDADLRKLFVARDKMAFVNMTYITDDTELLAAQAEEATMEYLGKAIKAVRRFDSLNLPPDLARQKMLLRLAGSVPAPDNEQDRTELAGILSQMSSVYGKGKYCPDPAKTKLKKTPEKAKLVAKGEKPCFDLGELSQVLKESHDYDQLTEAWQGWHTISPPIRDKFARYAELSNKGAKEYGFKDLGDLWRAGYDMSGEAFEADIERLWSQVKPLYDDLHCYVRSKLAKQYPGKVQAKGPIPAHVLGNMWAQEWPDIYPLVEPYKGQPSLNVTAKLQQQKYDEIKLVKLGEKFFTSLGMDPLPKSFWDRSMFKNPGNRDVVCHASAWDPSYNDDLRIKMCIKIDEEDLITIHHELGHDYYFHYYYKLPMLFQNGANDGFHEGIGDTLALSVTPKYLKDIGLLDAIPKDDKGEINQQMKMALEKVAFLPFGLLIDQWRWGVFNGKIPKDQMNKAWWDLRLKYQGVAPPVPRSEADFDPGAKYHVPGNTPYIRFFLARIYQFQFHRALCKAAGFTGPLSQCSIYGNKAAGEKLMAMLKLGASKPWPEALEMMSGEKQADASALIEYFAPLQKWLKEQNKGETCGW
ncbi:MAG: M2 family metallopeptidase [Polyangiaceae bacterium]